MLWQVTYLDGTTETVEAVNQLAATLEANHRGIKAAEALYPNPCDPRRLHRVAIHHVEQLYGNRAAQAQANRTPQEEWDDAHAHHRLADDGNPNHPD